MLLAMVFFFGTAVPVDNAPEVQPITADDCYHVLYFTKEAGPGLRVVQDLSDLEQMRAKLLKQCQESSDRLALTKVYLTDANIIYLGRNLQSTVSVQESLADVVKEQKKEKERLHFTVFMVVMAFVAVYLMGVLIKKHDKI